MSPSGEGLEQCWEWGDQLEPLGRSRVHPLMTDTEERGLESTDQAGEGLARTQSLLILSDRLSKGAQGKDGL